MLTKTFSKILVATDFSDGSDDALAVAIDLAKRLGSTLEIVHVVEFSLAEFPFAAPLPYDAQSTVPFVDRELAARAAQARRAGLVCETKELDGSPDVEIVRRASETGVDLVVVGTRGRTGLAHVLMGSVAERVVQHAGRAVLAVPSARSGARSARFAEGASAPLADPPPTRAGAGSQ